jgi:hypothetical protein
MAEATQQISNSNWKGETVLIRDQYYVFKITLYNTVTKRPLNLPFKVVENLVIEENLSTWWTKGWLTINNNFEVMERATAVKGNPLSTNQNQNAFFAFRHDGRNRINIRIDTVPNGNNLIKSENWSMNYDFVIYDIEDIETDSSIIKLKKIYFIDERYQILAERNIPWSTSTHGSAGEIAKQRNVPISYLLDSERKMVPNDAIKSIIQTAGCNDFALSPEQQSQINVGFDDSGSIAKPNISLANFDDDNWSTIDTNEDNSIFYTSPANSNALNDINHMLSFAKGKENDPIFLRLNRFSKKWSLVSLSDIFSKGLQIERISIQDGLEPQTKVYIPRAALFDDSGKILNVFSGRTSVMRNYKFASMAPIDDMRLTNRPVHKMDFTTGVYNIYFEENKIENVFENIKNLGRKGLYTFNGGNGLGGNQIWLNINQTKTQGISLENSFITQGSPDLMMVKMLKDVVFLNQALYFQSDGLTLRQPGTFLFVDRADSADRNLFDDKFLGQWLINKVVHYFDSSKYLTDVYATKIDGLHNHWDVLDKNW